MEQSNSDHKIIQDYTDKLNEYKFIVTPILKRFMEDEREPYIGGLNVLYDIYMFQNYLVDNIKEFFNNPVNKTLTLFFIKVSGDLFALRQCLMVGQLISASSISRNIFETYIDTRLILDKDSEERSTLYENHQYVLIWLRMQTYKKYIEELELNANLPIEIKKAEIDYYGDLYKEVDEKTIKENYEKVKEDYHPKYPYHWAWKIFKDETKKQKNPSREFICKKLGIYNDYLHVYSTSSLAVHNQPFMANFIIKKEQQGITSTPIFSDTTT